jgi:hypothetical protein
LGAEPLNEPEVSPEPVYSKTILERLPSSKLQRDWLLKVIAESKPGVWNLNCKVAGVLLVAFQLLFNCHPVLIQPLPLVANL